MFAVGDSTNFPVNYDVTTEIITTNDFGNYFIVLSNLNNYISGDPDSNVKPHYYRYETGTSMSAPAVSGVLALMQDFFTNTLHTTPSPALLKAMLINGARVVGNYKFALTNSVNDQGWGLVQLPNSLPFATATNASQIVTNTSRFLERPEPEQLAGHRRQPHLYRDDHQRDGADAAAAARDAGVDGSAGRSRRRHQARQQSRSRRHQPRDTARCYYGNNFASAGNPPFSLAWDTNFPPSPDVINNVENIFLAPPLGTNYSITVVGAGVNVNAVTAQTNNITQDYALVIACGEGEVTNALTVVDNGIVSNPTGGQDLTYITTTNNAPLMNQFVGANSPLLGTNSILAVSNSFLGTVPVITLGQTNQWHFYIATNSPSHTSDYTNAGFITFLPPTLSLPRMGVYADTQADATQPEADIDLYVTTDPTLTNLNPVAISNCVNGGVTPVYGTTFYGVSLSRGGTEFVVDTNSQPGEIYYIGVKSEDANGSEYDFLSVFSNQPFSATDPNTGLTVVHGIDLPINIPDGSPKYPGTTNIIALCLSPANVAQITVTNQVWHQNFGDLIGVLNHNNVSAVLNNHDAFHNTYGNPPLVYDDANPGHGAIPTDGPGSLRSYVGQSAIGPWILNETDDALTQTGTVAGLDLLIRPHQDFNGHKITVLVPAQGWFYDYIDVPPGYTNLTVTAIDLQPNPPNYLLLGVELGAEPTLANTNSLVQLTVPVTNNVNGYWLENSVSIGPPLPPGRYYVGIYNPDTTPHYVTLYAVLGFSASAVETVEYVGGPVPLLDDAVTTDSIYVTNTDLIQSLNVGIIAQHPRISDLVFSLIAPDGSRYLLMQNRGGTDTNGCGAVVLYTNIAPPVVTPNGSYQANTNSFDVGETSGTLNITYNFYTEPDEMTVYYGTTIVPANLLLDTGMTNNPPLGGGGAQNTAPVTVSVTFPPPNATGPSTFITIIMNQFGNPASTNGGLDAWTYTYSDFRTNFYYLTFTENTNYTTTPIKFAPTPFVPSVVPFTNSLDDFESATPGDYAVNFFPIPVDATFNVDNNQVTVVNDPADAQGGSNFLALANGSISTTLNTIPGKTYSLTFDDRGPGIAGWWQGDNNANDAINGNNGQLMNGTGFTPGVVSNAFNLNGVNNFVLIQANNSALDVGQGSGFTIEGWINPSNLNRMLIVEYENALATFNGNDVGVQFGLDSATPGYFDANIKDTTGGDHLISPAPSAGPVLTAGVWQHVALTYDKLSGNATFFVNGSPVAQTNIGTFTPQTSFTNILLGARTTFNSVASPDAAFAGGMDEISFYNRALSDSEILAIYSAGSAGKYDPTNYVNLSPAQSLAEATVSLADAVNGAVYSSATLYGANTNWQQETITFTATGNQTALAISGIEPGMLLDTFALVQEPGDLYYLPEQDMTPLVGTPAAGVWEMEVLDDRAGATNNATLTRWKLDFTFANTNVSENFGSLTGGVAQTNTMIANSLAYYQVNVPTNASFATNILWFASLPVNVWFSTQSPPTITNAGDMVLIPNATNGLQVISTNTVPLLVPGSTYYLVLQNTNGFSVNFAVEVDFDHGNAPGSGLPAALKFSKVKAASGRAELSWTPASGAQYQVQWADSLTSPMNWHTIASPRMTTINGVSTFTDDGSQTAPLHGQRYYRLVQTPAGGGATGFGNH